MLVEDFGIEPGPELRQLHEAILRADSALEPAGRTAGAPSGARPARPGPCQLPRDIDDDLDAASRCLEQALMLARVAGDPAAGALASHALAEVRREQGRLDEAMHHRQGCLVGFREIGFRHWEARALDSLGTLLAAQGKSLEARAARRMALAVFRELGMPEAAGVAAWLVD